MDVSSDLTELGNTPVAVISAGIKSILDIPRTLEYLVCTNFGFNFRSLIYDNGGLGNLTPSFPILTYRKLKELLLQLIEPMSSLLSSHKPVAARFIFCH